MRWEPMLAAFSALPASMDADDSYSYTSPSAFARTLQGIMARIDEDLETIRDGYMPLFSSEQSVRAQTNLCIEIMREWALSGNAPSLAALNIAALEMMEVKDTEFARLALLGSVVGEIENTTPYHSNMHYRKVLLQLIRLVVNHNEIYAGTSKVFSDREICLLIAAACIHDVGHDGLGNTMGGVHQRGRLETRSFDIMAHWMKPMGFDSPETLGAIKTMLMGTDVSPVGDPRAPVNQMKAAYRHHFLNQASDMEPLNLNADLKVLETDSTLSMMAVILQEADIATSAGIDYAVTKFETSLIGAEYHIPQSLPQHIINFLRDVCARQFLSDAGQRLYAANMARIYALAQKDVEGGNLPYPDMHHAELVVGAGVSSSSSRTLH